MEALHSGFGWSVFVCVCRSMGAYSFVFVVLC